MEMWSLYFSLLLILAQGSEAVYQCSSTPMTVKYQGVPYYYPAQGTDDHYGRNLYCTWEIKIPWGYYIELGFHGNLATPSGGSDVVETTIVAGVSNSATFYTGNNLDRSMPALCDNVKINLQTFDDSNGNFGFNVTWVKQDPPMFPSTVTTLKDYGFVIKNLTELNVVNTDTYTIDEDTQLSMSSDCSNLALNVQDLNAVWVYEGTSPDISQDHKTLNDDAYGDVNSIGNSLTLYSPVHNAPLQSCIVLAQDDKNFKQFEVYGVALDPLDNNWRYGIQVDWSSKKPSALTYVSGDGQPYTLYNITYTVGREANVLGFNNIVTPLNFNNPDVIFTPATLSTQLPYKFSSSVITLMMSSGEAIFQFHPQSTASQTNSNANGNTRIVRTPNNRI